ncbi:MAG: single-stranded DNA-binding protein [Armatimonadota bacterium]
MVNRVVLVGRLASDPERRYTPSGVPVTSFRIAVADPYRRTPEGDFESSFFTVITWQKSADYAANYLQKGRLVAVDGRLQQRSWTGQDGTRRSVVEIVAERVQGLDRPREATQEPGFPAEIEHADDVVSQGSFTSRIDSDEDLDLEDPFSSD